MNERTTRLVRLREGLLTAGLDGLVVSAPSNVFYLSGFRGSSGALLLTAGRVILFSDFRYRLQAREQAPACEFLEIERQLYGTIGEEARRAGLTRLGFDASHLTCELRDQLAGGAGEIELAPASGLVEDLRAVKSTHEIARIQAAAILADAALPYMVSLMRPGAKERDIALAGEYYMRQAGAEEAAFPVIVASGPRSALPHAETTDRALQAGDLVVVDMGARLAGYCSDMTRTFAVAYASAKAKQIYGIVHRAQRAALAGVRVGAVGGELDSLARAIIANEGYGDDFGHGLGHGVGIDVHEAPRLRREETSVLVAGQVVTVEPGIYLDGIGGVRLEDLIVVREKGVEVLTGAELPPELPVV